MPNVIYTATLDFTDNGVFNAGWRIKQGDFGSSSLNITLSDNGAIVFDDSIEPEIVFKRADGRSVISTMQSAGENSGYYIYNFVGNELAVPGPCVVDVKIFGSDSRTSTASCRFDVIEDTIGYDPEGAHTYINSDLVENLRDYAESALTASQEAQTSATMASTAAGEAVTSRNTAVTKAGEASSSATASSNSKLEAEAWAVGTRNGQAVPSTDPAYNNNSKYWSENIVQTNTRDDADLVKYIPRQYLNPDNAILGYYKHNSKEIAASTTAYHYEPFRIYKDIKYSFRQMYAYFCTFFYDDGTYEAISSTTGTHEDQLVTAAKDGWCYATVQGTFIDVAKIYSNVDAAYNDIPFIGFNKILRVNPTSIVHSGNYSSVLPTLADAKENSIYRLVTSRAMTTGTGTMIDVPYELKQDNQCICTLFMIGNKNSGGGAASQILVTETGRVYFRFRNLVSGQVIWTNWLSTSIDTIVVAADGSGDFTSLTQALKFAVLKEGTYVYVKKGTYDIIQEYKDLYGNDFFDNYTELTADTGIELKNRVTVDFAPNSFVQCIYDGNNTYVQNRFAPMISGEKGFTLINCNITSKKVRYSFHDERAQSTDYYHNKYIGCHFNHDKGGGSGYIQTIGGGLGVNGLVEIDNCIFENASSTGNILSWHNSKASEARSQIFVRNSMVKGTIRFSYYGASILVSTMFVNGCKMYTNPIITQETQDYNTVNVEVLAWGNDVGTF